MDRICNMCCIGLTTSFKMPRAGPCGGRGVDGDGHQNTMTVDEFKKWIDADGDGRISREELTRAMRLRRVRFARWKGMLGIRYADDNGNGYIDDAEMDGLIEYVQRSLGLQIVA